MAKGRNSEKDKSMAANLKAAGVTRRTGACPNCHKAVPLGGNALIVHLRNCGGAK
jgi:hypothetical protein